MSELRYMGTKRFLAPFVREFVDGPTTDVDRFVDLFSGTGSVAAALAGRVSVTCNDALSFPPVLARARFLRGSTLSRREVGVLVDESRELFQQRCQQFQREIAQDDAAITGGAQPTQRLLAESTHAGNSDRHARMAEIGSRTGTYDLARLYFGRGYFSTRQAIALDVLRQVIDSRYPNELDGQDEWSRSSSRDALIAGWVTTASIVANSPGHTAQYLNARTEAGFRRVRRSWSRDVFAVFEDALSLARPDGRTEWRRGNRVTQFDATKFPESSTASWNRRTVLYADPPYTKDHYSRFYHVLETLVRYDYPDALGAGRVRSDRHLSDFCYKSRAGHGFEALGQLSANSGATLMVSYPSNGLLREDAFMEVLKPFGRISRFRTIERDHSTMGASKGSRAKRSVENLYVLSPA